MAARKQGHVPAAIWKSPISVLTEPLKRAFYEVECIKGNWSVRELKRQAVPVKYALAGMANRLFASQYQLKLPSKELRADG